MDVEVELSRIIINETSDQQIIVLKERHGTRGFPIVIGIVEIFAIDRRLKGIKPPRPMTHDLLASVIEHLGAKIERIVIDDLRKEVRVDGRTVSLSPKEFQLLKLLASSPGRVFTNREILEELWPPTSVSYATGQDVQKYVYLLRRKVEVDPKRPKLILTARGFGYRLAV